MKKIIIKKKSVPYINKNAYRMFEHEKQLKEWNKKLKRDQLYYAKVEKNLDRMKDEELNHTDLKFLGSMSLGSMLLLLYVIFFLL